MHVRCRHVAFAVVLCQMLHGAVAPVGICGAGTMFAGIYGCTLCAAGTYQESSGQTFCNPVPAGKRGSSCADGYLGCQSIENCPMGTYSYESQGCNAVPGGSYGSSCASGGSVDNPGVGCTSYIQCPAGTFSLTGSTLACQNCAAGFGSNAGMSSCYILPCQAG